MFFKLGMGREYTSFCGSSTNVSEPFPVLVVNWVAHILSRAEFDPFWILWSWHSRNQECLLNPFGLGLPSCFTWSARLIEGPDICGQSKQGRACCWNSGHGVPMGMCDSGRGWVTAMLIFTLLLPFLPHCPVQIQPGGYMLSRSRQQGALRSRDSPGSHVNLTAQ